VRLAVGLAAATAAIAAVPVELYLRSRPAWTGDQAAFEPAAGYYTRHRTLGYAYLPGAFTVTLSGPFSFTITHDAAGRRITAPPAAPDASPRPRIWVFGCSLTHGWSLNDDETYPWVLQRSLPDYDVVNFGVDGYGTVQSLTQFREALATDPPPVVAVVAYASIHDQRNRLTRRWRKTKITRGTSTRHLREMTHPYGRVTADGKLEIVNEPLTYATLPGVGALAITSALDDIVNWAVEPVEESQRVTRAVIEEMARVAAAHGVRFVVASIVADRTSAELLAHLGGLGIATADISVDLSAPGYRNLPFDPHPSRTANAAYAANLAAVLCGRSIVRCR
jgi:hypothetical protein